MKVRQIEVRQYQCHLQQTEAESGKRPGKQIEILRARGYKTYAKLHNFLAIRMVDRRL
jgi:hypothetical protein